mmetsp:Transcript_7304/g.7524  ORF Transcript_7304/g.7524 Transcript_7304/m.7524 type:complete len:243 (-) Transcript_7304:54-782(-)
MYMNTKFIELLVYLYLYIFSTMVSPLSFSRFMGRSVTGTKKSLVLISGSTGTGKSTFGMEVAISQGILKCISTDTIRQVSRPYNNHPALHRSSYDGVNDPVDDWKECCDVLHGSMENIVKDSIRRGVSLVLEGVLVVPDDRLINLWTASGGIAVGCVLTIPDPELHRQIIFKRGEITKKGEPEKLAKFDRVRRIHDEMCSLAETHGWQAFEQMSPVPPHPVDRVSSRLQDNWRMKLAEEEAI